MNETLKPLATGLSSNGSRGEAFPGKAFEMQALPAGGHSRQETFDPKKSLGEARHSTNNPKLLAHQTSAATPAIEPPQFELN